MRSLPNLCALLGCLAGYLLACLVGLSGVLDGQAAALLTAFLPSAGGLAAYVVGRHFDT